MLKEKDWRRGRTRKENEFYTKPNNGGIIKKSLLGIDEIKQSIEAAERRAKAYENEWLDSVVNNADTRQIDAAKTRMEQAKSSVVSLSEQLSDAYGLGEDGYWNTQRTARSVQMGNNPDHVYAIGNSTMAAAKPQSAYAAGTKEAAAQPKTQGQTAAQNISNTSAASRRMEWDISQLQDEIVNGQDLSEYRKGQLNDKLAKLTAQKEVLDWEDTKTGTPTAADYEVRENYYQGLWNQNQDDIVNGLGNNTLVQGSDEWYDILKKGDDLLEKRDAYRMGKMGMLDGDDSTDTSATSKGGGGKGTVSLDADDAMMYTGQPGFDDGEEAQTAETTDESSEQRQSDLDTVKDLMENIRKYMLDKRDPSLNKETFNEIYNNGELLIAWSEELKKLVGEEKFNEFISIYDNWDFPEKIDTPEEIIAEQNGEQNLPDNESNIVDDIIDAAGNFGKWVYDSVTGGIKWVQDNSDKIEELYQWAEAEKKKILETPITEFDAKEFEKYIDLRLDTFEDELDQRRDEEYNVLLEIQVSKYTEIYNNRILIYEDILKKAGVTTLEEFIEFSLEEDNWIEKTETELDEKYSQKLENEEATIRQAYEIAMALEEMKEKGEYFEVGNQTGKDIDPDVMNNIMLLCLNEEGGLAEEFRKYYEGGNAFILINQYNVEYLTKEEAQTKYVADHEEAKELFKLLADMATAKSIGDILITIAEELVETTYDKDTLLKTVDEVIDGSDIDIAFKDSVKDTFKSFVLDMSIDLFMDMVSSLHYDIQDIKEGNYIEFELFYNVTDDGEGDYTVPDGDLGTVLIQKATFYDAGGVYVYDQKNALNTIASATIGGY